MDTIADMFARIINAQTRRLDKVVILYSRVNFDIAKILKHEGYVKTVKRVKDGNKEDIEIGLRYASGTPAITSMKRISKSGRRIYRGWRETRRVLNGAGTAIISTSKGVMTDRQARKQKVGGEVICELY
ncbi:MAG: 30S ribosomal protein S8 [Patescibacteria group bacterium]|nr:30S ribosomal protein S8 [Patescibacteria group bacterium]